MIGNRVVLKQSLSQGLGLYAGVEFFALRTLVSSGLQLALFRRAASIQNNK